MAWCAGNFEGSDDHSMLIFPEVMAVITRFGCQFRIFIEVLSGVFHMVETDGLFRLTKVIAELRVPIGEGMKGLLVT